LVGLRFELPKSGDWQSNVETVYGYQQSVTIKYIEGIFDERAPLVAILTDDEIKNGYLRNNELSAMYGAFAEAAFTNNAQTTYIDNRCRSLAHRWLSIIEDPSRNAEPVKDFLATECSFDLGEKVSTFAGFQKWLSGPASAVSASTHRVSDFKVRPGTAEGQYELTMVLSWNGLLKSNGVHMIGKTSHKWRVVDAPADSYARIQTMDVVTLVPFKPAKGA